MGTIGESIITIISGILFYIVSLFSILGIIYGYLKSWPISRTSILALETTATNPVLIIVLKVLQYVKYLAIPAIIWGLVWYTMYADLKV
jgi:hypothetical protein